MEKRDALLIVTFFSRIETNTNETVEITQHEMTEMLWIKNKVLYMQIEKFKTIH